MHYLGIPFYKVKAWFDPCLICKVEGLMRLMEGEHVGPFNLGNPGEFTMFELAQVYINFTKSVQVFKFALAKKVMIDKSWVDDFGNPKKYLCVRADMGCKTVS